MSEVQAFSVEQVLELLRKVDLFEGLPEGQLREVAAIVEGLELDEGEVLFQEGEPGDAFYAVFSGAVEIVKRTASGTEKMAIRRTGEAFGEMALLDDAPRSATARAIEETRLVTISRESFQALLGGDSLATRVLRALSKALRALGLRFAASEKLAAARDAQADDVDAVSRAAQRAMLPRRAPSVPGYDIAAGTTTEETGRGDTVWDWMQVADGRTALLAYDVQGEGLPPSHQLGAVRVLLRALAAEESDPKEILRKANAALSHAAVEGAEQFVECGIAVLGEDGTVEWASAGRVPAGQIRRNGTFEEFGSHGPTLGMMEGFRYSSSRIQMGPGDVFVVLSQASVGLFRGAADLVAQVQGKPAGEVVSTLHRAVRKAHGENPEETSVIFLRKH